MIAFAGVPEWLKGSDCKSDARASMVRIHPPAPYLDLKVMFSGRCSCTSKASLIGVSFSGYGSMVEPQPSKLMARVRFPLPAPNFSLHKYADVNAFVAQLVEHTLGKGEVGSSNLLKSSISAAGENLCGFFCLF